MAVRYSEWAFATVDPGDLKVYNILFVVEGVWFWWKQKHIDLGTSKKMAETKHTPRW